MLVCTKPILGIMEKLNCKVSNIDLSIKYMDIDKLMTEQIGDNTSSHHSSIQDLYAL
jgi:hypothetical protein